MTVICRRLVEVGARGMCRLTRSQGAPTIDSVYDLPRLKDDPARREAKFETAAHCPIPDRDPVYGVDGPLPRLYREAAAQ